MNLLILFITLEFSIISVNIVGIVEYITKDRRIKVKKENILIQ
jgi:hypothetical protein